MSIDVHCSRCHTESCPGDCEPPIPFKTAADVVAAPLPVEVVESFVLQGRVTVVVAESTAGKTFFLLSMAAHVASGMAFHDRQVECGSVVYLKFEGDSLGVRLQGLIEHQGLDLENLYVLECSNPISPRSDKHAGEVACEEENKLIAALTELSAWLTTSVRPPVRLIILDTVRASMVGSEDASDTTSAYLRAVRRLLSAVPEAGAVLAHHTGWQDGEQKRRRERGSSTWRGNVDVTLFLEVHENDVAAKRVALSVATLKTRDHERAVPLRLWRRQVVLARRDQWNRPVNTCVIEPDLRSPVEQAAAAQAAQAEEDIKRDGDMVRFLISNPGITNLRAVRVGLGWASGAVGDCMKRVVRRGWVAPKRPGGAYVVTEGGRRAAGV